MGIRIKKNLCYALSDTKVGKGCTLIDDRFQDWALKTDGELYSKPDKIFPDFISWILDEKNKEQQIALLDEANGACEHHKFSLNFGILFRAREYMKLPDSERRQKLREFFRTDFAFQPEYGMPKIFGIIPPEEPSFYRGDDMIDYYEAGGQAKSKVQWLDQRRGRCGIYPNCMMVRIPGADKIEISKLDMAFYVSVKNDGSTTLPDRIMGGDYNRLTGAWSKDQPAILSDEVVKRLHKSYRPEIHSSVLLWTHYIGLFKDWKKTVNELRPCLYTYWS